VIELPEDEVQLWRVDLEAIAADRAAGEMFFPPMS